MLMYYFNKYFEHSASCHEYNLYFRNYVNLSKVVIICAGNILSYILLICSLYFIR